MTWEYQKPEDKTDRSRVKFAQIKAGDIQITGMQFCHYAALAILAVFSIVSGQNTQPISSLQDNASGPPKDDAAIPPIRLTSSPLSEGEVDARAEAPSQRPPTIPGLRAVSIVANNLGMPRLAQQVDGLNRFYGESLTLSRTAANALEESRLAGKDNVELAPSPPPAGDITTSEMPDRHEGGSSARGSPAARAPSNAKASSKASPAAKSNVKDYVKEPTFKGKPLARTEADHLAYTQHLEEVKQAKADGRDSPLPFPVMYLDQLANLDDKQAYEIFHRGTAEIPSAISESTPFQLFKLGRNAGTNLWKRNTEQVD